MEGKGIGASLPRLEDNRYLRGLSQFVGDVAFPGMLHAAFLRSPHAHATILAIRKPASGAGRVFVADDLAGVARIRSTANLPGYKGSDWPTLAKGKVRHVGEPIAMALGRSPGEAEDLAAAIEVDYAPLTPVVTMDEALAAGAPLVHEHWTDNILVEARIDGGDFEAARAAAVHVVSRRFRMNRQVPLTLEGRGCAAHYDGRLDELVVYCSHQLPVPLQIGLSQTLGLAQRRLRVIAPDVGGSFGLKSFLESETVCVAWAAMTLRRPVRWIQDRHESLVCDASCRDYVCEVTGYADAAGKVLALDCEVRVDAGAYSPWPWPAGLEGALALVNMQGPYDIKAFRGRGLNIVTNKPAAQPYRGVARPISCIGHELIMDALAAELSHDPAELRILNMVKPHEMPYVSVTRKQLDSGDYPQALRRALALVDAPAIRARQRTREPDGRLIGLGMASFYEQTAYGTGPYGYAAWGIELVPGLEPAVARLTGDGELMLEVGSHSHGQGHETTYAQIAHEVLGIDPARVTVRHGDTAVAPAGTGTYSSRSAVTVGGAIDKACRALKRPILQIGAHLLQCGEEEAAISDGAVVGPSGSVGFAEIGRAWYHHPENLPDSVDQAGLTAIAGHKPHDPGVYGYSSHIAVVAVDPATGAIELIDYAIVTDCGRRINPMIVTGQVLGGFANGLGNALFEESCYDGDGQPLATTFVDYLMPSAPSMPQVKLDFIETLSPFAPYGIKGVGESAAIGPPSAIVAAVNDALRPLGAAVYETPLTPQRVFDAIRGAGPAP